MVYMHFPSNLTEEELMLQAKYAKLKKKKKALQALKAPKQEPEKPLVTKRSGAEARDAREIARKLLKSGAIQAIRSPPPLPQNATFKRPRAGGRERKLSGGNSVSAPGGVASYQPFNASQEPPVDEKATSRVKYLYDSFVSAREEVSLDQPDMKPTMLAPLSPGAAAPGSPDVPERETKFRANTLLVTGVKSEEALKRRLSSYSYRLVVFQASGSYVTFDGTETASRALTDLDGSPGEDDTTIRASYSRRPPPPPPPPPAPPAVHEEARQSDRSLLTYDDIFE